jgi:hypothetical protein
MEPIPASVMNACLSERWRCKAHRRNCCNERKFGYIGHYPSPCYEAAQKRLLLLLHL